MKAASHRWALATAVALSLALGSRPARAAPEVLQDAEALAHFEQATRYFNEQDYAAAIPELKAAYALEPNPMLLYAWAQAERLAGSCTRAVELYRRFIATDPAPDQRQLAEANLLDCEAELPDPVEAETPDDLDAMEDEDETVPPRDDAPPRPWYADPAGGVLTGLGVGGVIGGGVMMAIARRKAREAPNAAIEGDYLQVRDEANRLNTVGIVVLSAGSALVLGGVIRYAVKRSAGRADRQSAQRPRWRPVITSNGFGITRRF